MVGVGLGSGVGEAVGVAWVVGWGRGVLSENASSELPPVGRSLGLRGLVGLTGESCFEVVG